MKVIHLRSWQGFKALIDKQYAIPPANRAVTWFRGQSNSDWLLQTTLDRFRRFSSDTERTAIEQRLLDFFRQELVGLAPREVPIGPALDLLARHHGLPSTLMDWTESPYIAAFFAFQGVGVGQTKPAAIWALNLGKLPDTPDIELIQDRELLWFNPRALSQRGVFVRIGSAKVPTEEFFGDAVTKINLPVSDSATAMRNLDGMNITARNLFRDLEGAVRSAVLRLQQEGE